MYHDANGQCVSFDFLTPELLRDVYVCYVALRKRYRFLDQQESSREWKAQKAGELKDELIELLDWLMAPTPRHPRGNTLRIIIPPGCDVSLN